MATADKTNDIKIGGTLTTAASSNILVHADEVYDESYGDGKAQSDINAELSEAHSDLTSTVDSVKSELTSSIEEVNSTLTSKIEEVEADLTTSIETVESNLSDLTEEVAETTESINTEITTIHEALDPLSEHIYLQSNTEGLIALVDDAKNTLLTITETGQLEINNELLAESGYSIKADGLQDDIIMAVIDANSNILFAIKSDGDCVVYKNLEIEGDTITFSENANIVVGTTTSDITFRIVDTDGNVLFWINQDGTVDFNGIPSDIATAIEGVNNSITTIEENISTLSTEIQEEITDKLSEVDESIATINDTIATVSASVTSVSESVTANSEAIATVSESVTAVNETVTEINDTVTTITGQIYVKENVDGLITLVDSNGNVLVTITESGQVEVNNELLSETGYSIRVDNSSTDALYHIIDADNNVLFSILSDGQIVSNGSITTGGQIVSSEGIIIDGSSSGISIVTKETDALFAVVDSDGNILTDVNQEGALMANSITGVCDITVINNEDFVLAFLDRKGRLLFGIKKDGTIYALGVTEGVKELTAETNESIEALEDKIDEKIDSTDYDLLYTYDNDGISDIPIPQELHCMEGRQLSCYYDTLSRFLNSEHLYRFNYSSTSAGATIYRNEYCWNYTPGSDVTDFTMTAIRLNRATATSQEKKTITVKVNHPLSTSLTKNVCIVGDSLVHNSYLTREVWDMLDEDGDCTINHIGTRGGTGYEHEGYGGWAWSTFLTSGTSSYTNAFWNTDDDCLDFQWYCEQNGFDGIDYMLIALGTNDISSSTAYNTLSSVSFVIDNAKTFIDTLLSEDRGFPNCKVGIGLPGPGADYWYVITGNEYIFRKSINTLNQLYLSTFDNGAYHENVTCFSHGMMTNQKYAFPYTDTAISDRYSEVTSRTLSNNVHPTQLGYQAWADGYYNMIRGFLTADAEAAE